jgi:hypothetical protein
MASAHTSATTPIGLSRLRNPGLDGGITAYGDPLLVKLFFHFEIFLY